MTRKKKTPSPEQVTRQLEQIDAAYRERREVYGQFVDSIQHLDPPKKAEAWLFFVARDMEVFGDQEALVYLASRGLDCSKQIEDLVAYWKNAEQYVFEGCTAGIAHHNFRTGRTKYVGRMLLDEAREVGRHSHFTLPDFWHGRREQQLSIDATMLRTVEWCDIGGFEEWWERLAKSSHENVVRYGVETLPYSFWLCNMCRSDFAIKLMKAVLERGLEAIEISGHHRTEPWNIEHAKMVRGKLKYQFAQHFLYASSIVFSNFRLRGQHYNASLVDGALRTVLKFQRKAGSWPVWSDDKHESIEATAMAVHALALARPHGSDRAIKSATRWLWTKQERSGLWFEEASPDPTYLTVLVLDAIELASGGARVSFCLPGQVGMSKTPVDRTVRGSRRTLRFKVALTFPGEIRPRVERIAEELGKRLGAKNVFYDSYYKEELARPDLDIYLQSIYHDDSELVVVFCCADYSKKDWCGLEWRAIRDLIKRRQPEKIMPLRLDETTIPGLYSIDGYLDIREMDDKTVADLICKRVRRLKP